MQCIYGFCSNSGRIRNISCGFAHYEFDGKGVGTLRLPTGSHDFSYSTEQNLLTLDFAEDSAADSSYSFSVDGKSLTLDTNTGTVYRLTRR